MPACARRVAFLIFGVVLLLGAVASSAWASAGASHGAAVSRAHTSSEPWIGTWEAASSGYSSPPCSSNCTIRNIVHVSIGGPRVRIQLSNVFGTAPLTVGHATVALPTAPNSANVAAGTLREVTFGGAASVTIPAGKWVVSDPVTLTVPAESDLLVTTFTPGAPTSFTFHPDAQETNFYTSGTDEADATSASAFGSTTGSYYLLTGVQTEGSGAQGAVVTFGDSITDGFQSTPGYESRWPNILADRLTALPAGSQLGVLNAGIGGNRILLNGGNGFGPAGIYRFQRDVIDQPGVKAVIILEGINDIQQTPHQLDPNQIIAGLQQLITMAHSHGLLAIGATLTPFEGWSTYNTQEEQTWAAVNKWIRTSGAYNAVIDFDSVVRDPADPYRYLPAFDSGDHLHPDNAGYMAMGSSINLADLGVTVPTGYAGPKISSVSSNPASAGQQVTLKGSGFGAQAGYLQFTDTGTYWGAPGNAATFTVDSWSDTAITFTVPQPSGGGAWHVNAGTTATVNVVDRAGAWSNSATIAITPTASMADYYDDAGTSPDSNQSCANLDGDGFSYSQQALAAAGLAPGATVTVGGLSYTWPDATACTPDNVVAGAQTILMHGPAGASTLGLLGTSVNGESSGEVIVHYSDGTSAIETISFGDWAQPAVSSDSVAATMSYRNSSSGTSQTLTMYVFATIVPVNPAKTVVSVTLPDVTFGIAQNTTSMHIFALALH